MSAPRTIGRSALTVGSVAVMLALVLAAGACTPATDAATVTAATDDASRDAAQRATASDDWRDLESELVRLTNQARVERGLDAALQVAPDLTAVARSHTARMADDDHLHHNPALTADVSGWDIVGENVGRGPSVAALHRALMGSPSHRANILDERYTQIGIGIDVRDGTVWVTQVFRTPDGDR